MLVGVILTIAIVTIILLVGHEVVASAVTIAGVEDVIGWNAACSWAIEGIG